MKGVRVVVFVFVKWVLIRVYNFEGGVSCIMDFVLCECLLCVVLSGVEGIVDGGMDVLKDGGGGVGSGGRMVLLRGVGWLVW